MRAFIPAVTGTVAGLAVRLGFRTHSEAAAASVGGAVHQVEPGVPLEKRS